MTSRPSNLGAASYETESSWAEATDTWGTRLQVLGEPVVPSDIQQRIAEPFTQQYAHETKMGVRGPWQGQFTIELALTGHGGTTAGALTATDLYTLLVNFFGNGSATQAGTTVDTSPTSASQFALVGGTVVERQLVRVGALGDGRCEGQFGAVLTPATTTFLTAFPATPNAGDVVYATLGVYPDELPASMVAPTSTRWLLQTANGQWSAKGCYPVSASFSGLNVGEQPRVSLTYGVSRWAEANETFPDATATDAKAGSIVAAGSCFLQDSATVTRQTLALRNWNLSIDMGVQPLMGPGGIDAYQTIIGAVRTKCRASLDLTIDAEASGTNTLNDIYTGTALQHCLMSLNVGDGTALGFYFKNCRPTNYVTQETGDGLNRRTLSLEAGSGPNTSDDNTLANWLLAMG